MGAGSKAAPLLIQLPAWPGKAVRNSPKTWDPVPVWERHLEEVPGLTHQRPCQHPILKCLLEFWLLASVQHPANILGKQQMVAQILKPVILMEKNGIPG